MRILVFAGPSVAASEIHEWLPEAQILPPIRRGDLIRQELEQGDVVLIIDGYFAHSPAIQHMEILDAIAKGAIVVGSSSMGALRAAELNECGMLGIGYIYEQYRHGALIGDDEVAILHDSVTYECYSDAMVNIRYNLMRAEQAYVIPPERSRQLIEQLKSDYFGNRSYAYLVELLRQDGFEEEAKALDDFLAEQAIDLKHADAVEALKAVQRWTRPQALEGSETSYLFTLRQEYKWFPGQQAFTEMEVLNYLRIMLVDFPERYRKFVQSMPTEDAEHEDVLFPLLKEPGVMWLEPLVAALQEEGLMQQAAAELSELRQLEPKERESLVQEVRSKESLLAMYARYWKVPLAEVGSEIRRRGFLDDEHFYADAKKIAFLAAVRRYS